MSLLLLIFNVNFCSDNLLNTLFTSAVALHLTFSYVLYLRRVDNWVVDIKITYIIFHYYQGLGLIAFANPS